MSSKLPHKTTLIFDTNILYKKADNGCNFREFNFNKLFRNVVDEIEERDLTEYVEIAIPDVVWNELYHQRLTSYYQKSQELEKLLEYFKFPHIQYEFSDINYENYLTEQVNKFKNKLENYLTNIIKINLPSETRFQSIISRAFAKKPPFEGISKKSDKGFKDALIWESVLEYKSNNIDRKVVLYTRDGLFNDLLAAEYLNYFGDEIILLDKEEYVIKYLANIEKEVNKLRIPHIEDIKYYDELRRILNHVAIEDIMFEIELNYNIGSFIYELSGVEGSKIKNVIEVTEDNSSDRVNFEIIIELNLTLSNIEREEDIDLDNEEAIFHVDYCYNDEIFFVRQVVILETIYKLESKRIGGEILV